MIELIPAIDIINGQCVRLTKGDYDQKTVYGNPLDMALEFENLGFERLHVVDLDGAKSKHIINDHVLKAITTRTNLIVDFGGGIKTDEDIEKAFGRITFDRKTTGQSAVNMMMGIDEAGHYDAAVSVDKFGFRIFGLQILVIADFFN